MTHRAPRPAKDAQQSPANTKTLGSEPKARKSRVTLTLPIELTNGNEGRSKHWGAAAKRRGEYESIIRLLRPNPWPIETPVRLVITRVLGRGQRLFDVDSLARGNAKEVIDAIVAAGYLPDDGPRHVVSCEYRQDATRRFEGPATVVEIEAVS